MTIKNAGLKFKIPLTPRRATTGIVIHHTDGDGTVETIHRDHLVRDNGRWAGIGYNFYVRRDGTIFEGRGFAAQGSHTLKHNPTSVGIAFEGRYHSHDREMPAAQFDAGVWLLRECLRRYGNIPVVGHRDLRATACPGQFFPFAKMRDAAGGAAVTVPSAPPQTTGNDKAIWDFFTGKRLNEFATPGLMGNLFAESGLRPNNLQNTFETRLGMTDESYTAGVDNGTYTNFVRDSAGYGLAQWTFWSRKEALLNFAKASKEIPTSGRSPR